MKTCKLKGTRFRTDSLPSAFRLVRSGRDESPRLPAILPPKPATHSAASSTERHIVQWKEERQWLACLAKTNPSHHERVKVDFERAWFTKFDGLLDDTAVGPVWLRDERVAAIVDESLHYRDGKVYRLDAFTIMPNHVHTVVKPLAIREGEDGYHALASIMQSLKGYTSLKCNQLLGQTGEFWAHESYDHWVRDTDEWQRIVAYVVNNPVKAGYVERWQEWKWNYRRK